MADNINVKDADVATKIVATHDLGDSHSRVATPHAQPSKQWSLSFTFTNSSVEQTKAAPGAGLRLYVAALQVSYDVLSATTLLEFRNGAAGTVLWRARLIGSAASAVPVGVVFPIPLRFSDNTLLAIATATAVTGNVYVNVQGFTAA